MKSSLKAFLLKIEKKILLSYASLYIFIKGINTLFIVYKYNNNKKKRRFSFNWLLEHPLYKTHFTVGTFLFSSLDNIG